MLGPRHEPLDGLGDELTPQHLLNFPFFCDAASFAHGPRVQFVTADLG
jgi:hypothetical protein